MTVPVLARLAAIVREDDGLLADVLRAFPEGDAPYGAHAARGPRAGGHVADLELVVEAVREGYLLHYGTPRLMSRDDDDLALLAGDRLYALGLERLAIAGDLDAIRALADIIALSAQAQSAGDDELADAIWQVGATEVGWGPHPALEAAKDAARAGDSTATERLRIVAREIAGIPMPVA